MKKVHAVFRAGYTNYDGLDTYRAMPTRNIPIEMLDPFIFLNHHGYQVYLAGNAGLPFGPHPHKGFETVTFIVEGELIHKDSTGFTSNIKAGGIQWMTAGKGIIHSELSSDEFKKNGGPIEILQLWINLPSALKNSEPAYTGLQKDDVPLISFDEGRVKVHLVSGKWEDKTAPIQTISDVHLSRIEMQKNGQLKVNVEERRVILFYVIKGKVNVNGEQAETHDLVEFEKNGKEVEIKAEEDAQIIFGHALPTGEPIIAHGPFVMNTQQEITQAFLDYQQGKFGVWKD